MITICLNADKHIEQTINSVIGQSYANIEYIVIDGLSVDNTLNIINKYRDQITVFVSEPDSGIADAMNKGIRWASGDFVVFLHADDYFADTRSLATAVQYLPSNEGGIDCDILSCDILYGKQLKRLIPRGFNAWMYLKTGIFHQGTLCSRALLQAKNGFDPQFKIAMDYDFFLRCYKSGAKIKYTPHVLAVMRDSGISSRTDWKGISTRFLEEYRIHIKNGNKASIVFYWIYWLFYLPYRAIKYLACRCK